MYTLTPRKQNGQWTTRQYEEKTNLKGYGICLGLGALLGGVLITYLSKIDKPKFKIEDWENTIFFK